MLVAEWQQIFIKSFILQLVDYLFFANVTAGWTVATDQSSDIKSNDLQIAKLSGTSFSMNHQMGLAVVVLNSTTIYDSYTYTYTAYNNQGTPSTSGGNTWYASSAMSSTNKPYRYSNTKAYFIRKIGASGFDISATQSSNFSTYKQNKVYAWSASVPVVSASNSSTEVSVSYSGPPYLQATWNMPCFKAIITYTTPYAGKYAFKCWGADGGDGCSTYYYTSSGHRAATSAEWNNGSCRCWGGNGGYTYGILSSLAKSKTFYICVGGAGTNASDTHQTKLLAGGYNGGGQGSEWNNNNSFIHNGAGGGGATHIATASGLLSTLSKSAVLMVAGGGGGAGGHEAKDNGGAAGGTSGYRSSRPSSVWALGDGGTQSAGGGWTTPSGYVSSESGCATKGGFGYGGNHTGSGGGGGGGAGYYGGAGCRWNAGGGGSSYINGHSGCTQQNSTYIFTSTTMIDGANIASSAATNPSGSYGVYRSSLNGYTVIEYTFIP